MWKFSAYIVDMSMKGKSLLFFDIIQVELDRDRHFVTSQQSVLFLFFRILSHMPPGLCRGFVAWAHPAPKHIPLLRLFALPVARACFVCAISPLILYHSRDNKVRPCGAQVAV